MGLTWWRWNVHPRRVIEEHKVLGEFLTDIEFYVNDIETAKIKAKELSNKLAEHQPINGIGYYGNKVD